MHATRDAGERERLARGVYRLAELPPLSDPDLATVDKRVPQSVVCLISALAYHELTTQIPHEVHLVLPRTARSPVLAHPPLCVFHTLGRAIRFASAELRKLTRSQCWWLLPAQSPK